ncbi:MAG: outer membrane protein [Gammaproteobacteria bacterium]|jgi:outer membrane protein
MHRYLSSLRHTAFSAALSAALAATSTNAFAIDLAGVFELAKRNDPTYLAAGATHEAALEQTVQAKARLYPLIDAAASYGRTHSSLNPPGQPWRKFSTTQLSLTITQPVYRRDLLVNLDQAKSRVAKADVDYAFSLQELMLRSAQLYFDVLNSNDNVIFSRANKEAISEQLKQAQQRFDVGLIAITDVEEAKARFDLATSTEIEAATQLSDALEELREITGVFHEKGTFSILGDAMPLVTPEPDNINDWTNIAFEQNLQMASSNFDVIIAKKEIKLRDAGHYPSLNLVGNASASDASASRLLSTGTETQDASLSLQLTVPIYAGGRVTSETREARALYRRSLNAFELARRTVQSQTRQSFTGVKAGISRVQALRQAVVSNRSALDAVQAGFQVGTRTSVDVLDAQRGFFGAEFDYAEARYNFIIDILTLKQAAGTLSEADLHAVNEWLKQP